MKKQHLYSIIASFIFLAFSTFGNAQTLPIPTHAAWKADKDAVSLKNAYLGVATPSTLTFEILFSEADIKKMKAQGTELEFKWYYYYATTKEFMDSYTIAYDEAVTDGYEQTKLTSIKGDIMSGWWEVQVVISGTEQPISFKNTTQFQIFVL